MNSKIILGASLSTIVIIGMLAFTIATEKEKSLTTDEEKLVAELLIYDLKDSQALRIYEFQIGQFSYDVDGDSFIEFCGKFNEEIKNQYFEGVVKEDKTLSDFGLEKELPTSCLISDDAKWWKISEN